MYNRYIPEDASYARIEAEVPRSHSFGSAPRQQPFRFPDFLSGKEGGIAANLSGLLKNLRLDNFDSGDLLLMLILLYLLVEGDDLELVIALGLTLIMGLGDSKEESLHPPSV